MDEVNLRKTFWCSAGGMDMQSSKVTTKLQSLLDRQRSQVLVSEGNDFLLSHEQGQFVLALVI